MCESVLKYRCKNETCAGLTIHRERWTVEAFPFGGSSEESDMT